jgi:hypothetical protein
VLEKNIPRASRWDLYKLWKNQDQEFSRKNSKFQAFNVYVHSYIPSVSLPCNTYFHYKEVLLHLSKKKRNIRT